MRRPAAYEGLRIDDNLVNAMRADTITSDALPLLELAPDDDAQFYLRTPIVEAKETFAAWIAAPERRTPDTT